MGIPLNSSATALTSGLWRHAVTDDVPDRQKVVAPTRSALVTTAWSEIPGAPLAACQAGWPQTAERPPPPAPWRPSFQTCSRSGLRSVTVVPPTAVTYGWPALSETDRAPGGVVLH